MILQKGSSWAAVVNVELWEMDSQDATLHCDSIWSKEIGI